GTINTPHRPGGRDLMPGCVHRRRLAWVDVHIDPERFLGRRVANIADHHADAVLVSLQRRHHQVRLWLRPHQQRQVYAIWYYCDGDTIRRADETHTIGDDQAEDERIRRARCGEGRLSGIGTRERDERAARLCPTVGEWRMSVGIARI